MGKRGVVLFLVLTTILVAVILANIILGLALSQYRFTHHQASRIQAYYGALAAMNLARENLRNSAWTTGTYRLCKSGCSSPDINDSDIPFPVTITISDPNANGIRTITLSADYTYTP